MINSGSARAWGGDESQVIHQYKGGTNVPPPKEYHNNPKRNKFG